ncbi:MAG TPA: ABC transporter ATP-binding protein [Acidiferrobacteraceae bacterium]|nr:ABC transporter ATP-binding protein [Acidiferrobacteraceae bacterium]
MISPPAAAVRETAIEIQEVVGHYSGALRPSVDRVSLQVQQGHLLGLLGPNGAGKSTLLALLCALMRPRSGSVRMHGLQCSDDPQAYRGLFGLVPQTLAVYPKLTARENLAMFGCMSGLGPAKLRERTAFALQFGGLEEVVDRRVETYSGGLQRRLNLAVALLPDPPVLVLDEPTVGIDPQSRHVIHDSLRRLSREGKTIVYTSHYLDEVEHLCDDIAILDAGQLVAQGSLGELLAQFTGNQVELRLRPPEVGRAVAVLRALPGIEEVVVVQPVVTLFAEDPYRKVPDVLAALESIGVQPVSLSVGARDLEQAFLALTGLRLRDPA